MFEYERYVHDIGNRELLAAYLSRVALRIQVCRNHYGIN